MSDNHFYIQAASKEPWHVESDENCEVMLCGTVISVDSWSARVAHRWGLRRCPDCWMLLEKQHRVESLAPSVRVDRPLPR